MPVGPRGDEPSSARLDEILGTNHVDGGVFWGMFEYFWVFLDMFWVFFGVFFKVFF